MPRSYGAQSLGKPKNLSPQASLMTFALCRDSERDMLALKEQQQQIQQQLRVYEHENKVLKANIIQLETQAKRKDQDIEELLATHHNLEGATRPATGSTTAKRDPAAARQIVGLRNQLNLLKRDHQTLQRRYDQLSSSVKAARLDELELEVTQYYNEVLRLRYLLRQAGGDDVTTGSLVPAASADDGAYISSNVVELKRLQDQFAAATVQIEDLNARLEVATQREATLLEDAAKLRAELGGDEEVDSDDEDADVKRMTRKQAVAQAARQRKAHRALETEHQQVSRDLKEARSELKTLRRNLERLQDEQSHTGSSLQESRKHTDSYKDQVASLQATVQEMSQTNARLQDQLVAALNKSAAPPDFEAQLAPLFEKHNAELRSRLKRLDDIDHRLQEHTDTLRQEFGQVHAQAQAQTKELDQVAEALPQQIEAAVKLQSNWRRYRAQKEVKQLRLSREEKNQRIAQLQAVLRGHLARVQLLRDLQERAWRQRGTVKRDDQPDMTVSRSSPRRPAASRGASSPDRRSDGVLSPSVLSRSALDDSAPLSDSEIGAMAEVLELSDDDEF
ncbi:uncharacterized protein MONBRDRAFT_29302 [Monosiga brevicollis MX1]|uniref:Uncharacterized protein n=1 Tax=Monosiga brevicollis TaxID=81824 RepID=A9VAP9_MONBE|nr:uncharacterized protein MONBRDRAFT_29302 [Monosiga brevicollis MX1]EDQ85360.1 predicted protein [Monosiga brevicollis MX1]|eukprot:XP_001749771.1 hypothetical protein [Monosiga brevicollis MX1]